MKLLLFVCIVSLAAQLQAQTFTRQLSFAEGDVEALTVDPTGRVYIGSDSGSYLSPDNGDHWQIDTAGFTADEAFSLTVSPLGTVLAGTESDGMFRSTDQGLHWMPSGTGVPDTQTVFAVICNRNHHVFAATGDSGVYFSSDDGQTWSTRRAGLPSLRCWSLTETPSGALIVGLVGYIARSTDEGQSWTNVLTIDPLDETMSVASDSSGHVIAGTFYGRILRSLDDGNTWDSISTSKLGAVRCMTTYRDKIYAGTLGSGLILSTDNGGHWTEVNAGLTGDNHKVICATVSNQGYLFISTLGATVYRSSFPLAGINTSNNSSTHLSISIEPQSDLVSVHFAIPKAEHVVVKVFNVLGTAIATMAEGIRASGDHTLHFDARSIISGPYFIVLQSESGTLTKSVML